VSDWIDDLLLIIVDLPTEEPVVDRRTAEPVN
jgi:hypothetical protein